MASEKVPILIAGAAGKVARAVIPLLPKQGRELRRTDLAGLIVRSVEADKTDYAVIWGLSNNRASWWANDDRDVIGWSPRDSADDWCDNFSQPGDGIADRFQGGVFCEMPVQS